MIPGNVKSAPPRRHLYYRHRMAVCLAVRRGHPMGDHPDGPIGDTYIYDDGLRLFVVREEQPDEAQATGSG